MFALFETIIRPTARGAPAGPALATAEAAILAAGFGQVEYLALRSAADLRPLERASEPARLLVAAWLGGVRLIDNGPIPIPWTVIVTTFPDLPHVT